MFNIAGYKYYPKWLSDLIHHVPIDMLISVQITFGLVDASPNVTLLRLFHDLSRGVLNTGDRFVLEPAYADFPVESSVSTSITGQFQTIPLSVTMSAVIEFGKFITFNLTGDVQKESRPVPVQNAFQLLMGGARKKTWPKQRQLDRPNHRHLFPELWLRIFLSEYNKMTIISLILTY